MIQSKVTAVRGQIMTNSHKIKIIGLTGQSGAGKSTVRKIFEQSGFTVIDCDSISRNIASKKAFLSEIEERFGKDLLCGDGSLDRAKTASVIYGSKSDYEKYCGIIFPFITYDIMREIEKSNGIILLDAPTLFESGIEIICTEIISVTADFDVCVKRISSRDGITEITAKERLYSQHNVDFFRKNSDYIIENNGSEKELYDKTIALVNIMKG